MANERRTSGEVKVRRYFAANSRLIRREVAAQFFFTWEGSWGQHGPTWVLSSPDRPHVGPMNLAIRDPLPYKRYKSWNGSTRSNINNIDPKIQYHDDCPSASEAWGKSIGDYKKQWKHEWYASSLRCPISLYSVDGLTVLNVHLSSIQEQQLFATSEYWITIFQDTTKVTHLVLCETFGKYICLKYLYYSFLEACSPMMSTQQTCLSNGYQWSIPDDVR